MSNNRETCQGGKTKIALFDGFLSSLFATINSGKFWRCIRWCDEGRTVLITSPILFERVVLQSNEWKLQLNINDFASFVNLLAQLGFEKVLNQRRSKVQKFRHPDFRKNWGNFQTTAKKSAEPTRERMPEENPEDSAKCSRKERERNLTQEAKRQRNVSFNNGSKLTAMKRKTNGDNNGETFTHVKKRKIAVPATAGTSTNHDTFNQPMRSTYIADELIAAEALLSLSKPAVFERYSAVELMAAQSLLDLSNSCVQMRSVQELEAA